MVKIINYHLRATREGKSFVSLELQGDVELVQSMETGRFYATARKCSITSTFDEAKAKALLGTQLPGSIKRMQTEAYEFKIPETGEVIMLAHSYVYVPEDGVLETKPLRVAQPA